MKLPHKDKAPAAAERIGTKQQTISRLESGDYEGFTLKTLVKLAEGTQTRLIAKLSTSTGSRAVECGPAPEAIERLRGGGRQKSEEIGRVRVEWIVDKLFRTLLMPRDLQ